MTILEPLYTGCAVITSPTDFGEPYRRERKYTCWWKRHSQVAFDVAGDSFRSIFGKRVVADADIYLCMPSERVRMERDRMADERHIPSDTN